MDITCAASALVGGEWWVVWGDEGGRVYRKNFTDYMRADADSRKLPQDLTKDAQIIVRTH